MMAGVAIILSLTCAALLLPLLTSGESDFDRTTLNFLWCVEAANVVAVTLAWCSL